MPKEEFQREVDQHLLWAVLKEHRFHGSMR